jgi:hypothetical protein
MSGFLVNPGGTVQTGDIDDGAVTAAKASIATQGEAEAGTDTTKLVTPLRVAQAIAALAAGGGLQSMQVFTASGTWTKPAGVNLVKVTVVGGGGGGGSATTNDLTAGGGAGGGTAIEVIDVSGISSETITIGAGGAGGTGGGVGSDGGTTSFGAHCSATGGEGGLPNNSSEKQMNEGGIGVGGDLNLKGSPGAARKVNSTSTGGAGAHGGASFLGGGAPGKHTGAGENAPFSGTVGYGGGGQGGGGGNSANNAYNGSAGGAGVIIVEEYA